MWWLEHHDTSSDSSSVFFSENVPRARKLLTKLYSSAVSLGAVFSRPGGGSYNWVLGVSLPKVAAELILRVRHYPVFSGPDSPEEQVGILKWLESATEVPTPVVVQHDNSTKNPLRHQYILMRRIPGEALCDVWDELRLKERVSIARQMATIMRQIYDTPCPSGIGPLYVDQSGVSRVGAWKVTGGFDYGYVSSKAALKEFRALRDKEPESSFMIYLQSRWELFRPHFHNERTWARFIPAAKSALANFAFSNKNVLMHDDLEPRNIMVQRSSNNEEEWIITGVVDWDRCACVPAEIAFRAPRWLWRGADEDSPAASYWYDEEYSIDDPVPEESCRIVKEAFLDAMESEVPGFLDVVRRSQAAHLPRFFDIAKLGLHSNALVQFAWDLSDAYESKI